jgi:molecular chaperone HtpG
MTTTTEKKQFEANISELMNIIINSFYSNRDVFLRELISNASDAIDKQRHFDLQKGIVNKEYQIKIDPFMYENCLVIEDNGIGMDESDLIKNLSTIATSGTKEFVKTLSEKSDLIGQFGVGFYSAFLVADSVDVYTKKQDQKIYKWTSDANQYYTISELTDCFGFLDHGTRIVLHLKEDAVSYREEATLRRIISHHSSFIYYPIQLYVEKTKEIEEEKSDENVNNENADNENVDNENVDNEIVEEEIVEDSDEDEKVVVEDIENEEKVEEETKEDKKPKKTIQYKEWEKINGEQPIWYKKSNEVSQEEYETLYKTISKDWEKPLYWRQFQTEGAYEFRGILYIPSKMPFDLLGDRSRDKRNIKLYVKKVLVLNELDKEMLPDWMNFVTGVIDSADLPLNVSREMLQQNKVVKAMKSQLKKQIMNMMNDLLSNDELYSKFYENFHRHIKLGIHEGDDTLLSFLKIKNSKNDGLITLDEYVDEYRKNEEQKHIYYVTGSELNENLFAKLYKSKGYNVLYFDEPIDEFMLQRVSKFKDYELVNICKDHQTPWQSEQSSEEEEETKNFLEWIKNTLNDSNIENIKVSDKLTESTEDPLCVMSSKWGWTGNMEKIIKSQPLGDSKQMMFMKGKKIVELNLGHSTIQQIKQNYTTDEENAKHQIRILYQCGQLAAGFPMENTTDFVSDVYKYLQPKTNVVV